MRCARRAVLMLFVLTAGGAHAPAGVELSSFTASVNGAGDVVLNWTTASETNNFGFRVQRSPDNQTAYQTLAGIFVAGNGTTSVPHDYAATDTSATQGTWYYRLQQIDLDNEVHYTFGVLIHIGAFGQYAADASTRLLLHLDETSGTLANDLSGNATHGTITGTVPQTGRFAGARRFAAPGHRVRIPDGATLHPAHTTVEAWVFAEDYGTNPLGVIVVKGRTGADDSYRLGILGAGRHAVFTVRTAGGVDSVEGTAVPLEDGRWYHLAGSYDGAAISLTVNGLLQGTRPLPGPIVYGDAGVFLGSDSAGTAPFAGVIDEVRISSVVRPPSAFNLQLKPQALAATLLADGVRLSWQNGGGGIGLLRYRIGRQTDPGVFAVIDSVAASSYDDLQVPSDVSVTYNITPVDSTGFAGLSSDPVSIDVPPSPPVVLSPAPGATLDTLTARLVWRAGNRSADRYWLEYAGDSLFTSPVPDSLLTDTTTVLTGLLHNQRLWWRVRAHNAAGWGTPSPARSFRAAFTVSVALPAGWAMVSLPVRTAEDSVIQVFPLSVYPHAFSFATTAGYIQERRMRNGAGYWAKFTSAHTQRIEGTPAAADTIPLATGWNLVGSTSLPVDTADAVTIPPGLLLTAFFGYDGALTPVPTLIPGAAYWVKSSGSGNLVLGAAVRRRPPDTAR